MLKNANLGYNRNNATSSIINHIIIKTGCIKLDI